MSEETEDPGSEEVPAPKKLTKQQWAFYEKKFGEGEMSASEICMVSGQSPQNVYRHMNARGIKAGALRKAREEEIARKEAERKAAAEVTFEDKRKRRAEAVRESFFTQQHVQNVLLSRLQKEIADGTLKLADALDSYKAIRTGNQAIRDAIDNMWRALDVDSAIDESNLPVLSFEDLTKAEIEKIQQYDDEDGDLIDEELPDSSEDDIVREGVLK